MKELFIPTKKNNYKPYLLRKLFLASYTVILVVVNTFGGVLGISKIAASDINSATLISLTNQERTVAGLNTLNNNSLLVSAAQAKAQNMFEQQYWDHFGPNGETPWQFITASGYSYVYAGENLAKGFRTSEGVVEAWMASPTHRDNILSKNYKDIGIAVVSGVLLGKETILVVQMFGNLTSEVQGSVSQPVAPVTKSPVIESGQIKAISITHPKSGDVLRDPAVLIKGNVEGDKQKYTVEIYDLENKIANIEQGDKSWEYSSEEAWVEGGHKLEAKVKGTNIVSDAVSFTVDITSPTIIRESIKVVREDGAFILSFDADEPWYELKVINGEEKTSFLAAESKNIRLLDFNPSEKVILQISDEVGNTSEIDITEYFMEGETEDYSNFNLSILINSIKSTDGINIIIVGFLLFLMFIEVFVLWRKGKLGRNIGDLFVIALWVTILTVGVFKGFGGISS
ncbi:MAG: CAP domain-containing protein [Candidatus Dojkabacteria bacterium]|nr:CAP domain-containing protein [Candidatus Dojkabacteria bacterium]